MNNCKNPRSDLSQMFLLHPLDDDSWLPLDDRAHHVAFKHAATIDQEGFGLSTAKSGSNAFGPNEGNGY